MSQSLCLSTSAGIESGIWHMTISFLNPFILKVCQCTINVRQIVRWATSAPGLVIIVRGSALLESDCTLTNSLIDDKDNWSVVFDSTVHVCVYWLIDWLMVHICLKQIQDGKWLPFWKIEHRNVFATDLAILMKFGTTVVVKCSAIQRETSTSLLQSLLNKCWKRWPFARTQPWDFVSIHQSPHCQLSAVRQTRPHSDATAVALSNVSKIIQSYLLFNHNVHRA